MNRFEKIIKANDEEALDTNFSLNNEGFITYTVIHQPGSWYSIQQRGFEPVNQDKYNIWSPIIGYSVIGHPEIPISAVDSQRVKTDTNYTADVVIKSIPLQ